MESYLVSDLYDLVTPDGVIARIVSRTETTLAVTVQIDNISPVFKGFQIDPQYIQFNLKSTIAQLGINGIGKNYILNPETNTAEIHVELSSLSSLGTMCLKWIDQGCYIGKLFAADPSRRVRDPDYLLRMFGRFDREGLPLLSLGGLRGSKNLQIEKVDGYTVALLKLKEGILDYNGYIEGFLPTLSMALKVPKIKTRELLDLHQTWKEGEKRLAQNNRFLLVRTLPLHIRTVFGRVVEGMLPKGITHTTANVLQPDTKASGDVYELFGNSPEEVTHIPLEFYTLEPHREFVFFSDRDQLQSSLENPAILFKAFETPPPDPNLNAAFFVVKGEQIPKLTARDWITRPVVSESFPGLIDLSRQGQMVQEYIQQQPSYPFLKAIEKGLITSQGVLFSRYFLSPLMKKMLLGDYVQSSLKRIYFQIPSYTYGQYFSHEDRSMLHDLAKFAIPVYWVDQTCGKILQYAPKPEKDTGMFVPINKVEEFVRSTVFGVYGSTLIQLQFEEELARILEGILRMRETYNHPLLHKDIPISLITGGGPGVMEVGNRVARKLGILSCANIVNFNEIEQRQNPYIDAKMTYRLDRLIERQAEFNLDFPIFLMGGYGTDFELALEGVRRKVLSGPVTPVLLLGPPDYWRAKITSAYQINLEIGTIAGSEWVSNSFYCAQTASQALKMYQQFFSGTLPIGKEHPISREGFFTLS